MQMNCCLRSISKSGIHFINKTRIRQNTTHRFAVGIVILGVFFVVWVNLAVGIIGEPDNLANLMYFGVLVVGLVGAIVARFRPSRMSSVLFAMALAQALVGIITAVAGLGFPPTPPQSLLILNGILIGLWVGSALLFRKAAESSR